MFQQILDISSSHKRRAGSVILVVALALVVLMSFAAMSIDYGMLVIDKNHLQRACDASALGAAQELKVSGNDTTDTGNATTVAIAIAGQNGVTVTSNNISFSDGNSDITVTANFTRGLFFARVMGIAKGNVGASATAGANGPPSNYTGSPYVVPIGIVMSDYDKYKYNEGSEYSPTGRTFNLIRHNKEALDESDLVLFDLSRGNNGKSKTRMTNQLLGIDKEPVTIYKDSCTNPDTSCQVSLNSNPASQGPAIAAGLQKLIDNAAVVPWNDHTQSDDSEFPVYDKMVDGTTDYSNPRVINIIVADESDAQSGSSHMPVRAFVPVYILGYTKRGKGDSTTVDITFLFLPTQSNLDPNLETSSGGGRTISLLN